MDDSRFWATIELAWKSVGGKTNARHKLADGQLPDDGAEDLQDSLDGVIAALRAQLDLLPAEELLAFDRILERKLYDIDRSEVQEHTDGSDDGFLYCRGFIVAVGQGYYDAVNANPARAQFDLECETMCYLSFHLYEEKFGNIPPSQICRESCSNRPGWPDLG